MNFNIQKISVKVPWTNVYGMARSLLAFSTLLTFVFNDSSYLFKTGVGVEEMPACGSLIVSIFCVFNNFLLSKILAIGILSAVVVGVYPRITGVLHWWVMYSFVNSASVLDGGDHIAAIITLLLIPITITDCRKNHWAVYKEDTGTILHSWKSIVAQTTFVVIKIQVALIYLNSAGAKLLIEEWTNGTAIYYWFSHPVFGYPQTIAFLLDPLISNPFIVTLLTWSVIIFEFILFAGLFMSEKNKKYLLICGILFHFAIAVVHGLVSFSLVMSTCLILYLTPIFQSLVIRNLRSKKAYNYA